MANSRETLDALDAKIFATLNRVGLTDVMNVGSVAVPGYFNVRFIEDGDGADALLGDYPTFDCSVDDLPQIDQEDEVTIDGHGTFRYLRRQSAGIGRWLVILGDVL